MSLASPWKENKVKPKDSILVNYRVITILFACVPLKGGANFLSWIQIATSSFVETVRLTSVSKRECKKDTREWSINCRFQVGRSTDLRCIHSTAALVYGFTYPGFLFVSTRHNSGSSDNEMHICRGTFRNASETHFTASSLPLPKYFCDIFILFISYQMSVRVVISCLNDEQVIS
jgi:hypothetical protein